MAKKKKNKKKKKFRRKKKRKVKRRRKSKIKKKKKSKKIEPGELLFKVTKKWSKSAYVDKNAYEKKYYLVYLECGNDLA